MVIERLQAAYNVPKAPNLHQACRNEAAVDPSCWAAGTGTDLFEEEYGMDSDFRMHRSAMAGVEAVEAATRRSFSRPAHEQFGIGLIQYGSAEIIKRRGG
jgi:hypothetical protein